MAEPAVTSVPIVCPLRDLERFDRWKVNHTLTALAVTATRAA